MHHTLPSCTRKTSTCAVLVIVIGHPRTGRIFVRRSCLGRLVSQRRKQAWRRSAHYRAGRIWTLDRLPSPKVPLHCACHGMENTACLRERVMCSECKVYRHPSNIRSIPSAHVARTICFFTIGKASEKKENSVDCTGEWFTESSFLCPTCRSAFNRHRK